MTRSPDLSTLELFNELLHDPDRKSMGRIAAEVCYLFLYYRSIPRHYFSRYLFKKDRSNIRDYLPGGFLYRIKSRFNEEDVREVVENKLYFDFFFRQFNVRLPNILMYNHRKVFVTNGRTHTLNSAKELRGMLDEILTSQSIGDSMFIKKTYWSYGGAQVYKVSLNEIRSENNRLDELYDEVIQTGYLFQETVKQHHALESFNPSCLNTIRFDTFIDKDGNIEIISAYFRTNIKNQHVDNDRVGGCEIPVDLSTGKLKRYGHLTLKTNGLKLPSVHPVTQVVFEEFEIPFFSDAKQLVLQVAGYVPGLRLVGWDVAIGQSGPILIEGNSDYDIAASDLAYGGYLSNPVFRKVLREINRL